MSFFKDQMIDLLAMLDKGSTPEEIATKLEMPVALVQDIIRLDQSTKQLKALSTQLAPF